MSINRKNRLLVSTAMAGAAMSLVPSAANGQDYGVYHGGSETLVLTNGAGETIEGARTGIWADRGPLDLINAGIVRGNGSYDGLDAPSEGGVVIAGGTSNIINSGTISGGGVGITTNYYFDPGTNSFEGRSVDTTVGNSGTIIGDTNDAIRLIGGGTITNSGLIAGRGGDFADGISMYRFDDQDMTGEPSIGAVVNQVGGTIEGNRFGIILSGGGVIENAGTIRGPLSPAGTSDGAGGIVVQSFSSDDVGQTGTITNGGLVTGGFGVQIAGSLDSAKIMNRGTIEGLATNGIENVSSGVVTVINEAEGTITGAQSGILAQYGAVLVDNAGTIRGNGIAGVSIQQPDSSIVNSGSITGASFGIVTYELFNPDTQAPEGLARNTTIENSGSIIGDNQDGVRLVGGGTVTNSGSIEGRVNGTADGVSTFAFGGQDISGPGPIGTVINQAGGTIAGFRAGVAHSSGGVVENAGAITGGTFAVLIQNGSETLVDASVANSGTMTGGAAGVMVFGDIESADIVNSGTITAANGAGVYHNASGLMTVTNEATGEITGSTSGVYSEYAPLVLNNSGTIRGNGTYDGFDFPPDAGVVLAGEESRVVNSGTISGAGLGITTKYAFNADTGTLEGRAIGTTVENSGAIIGDTNDGVRLIGGGTITNSGLIAGRVGDFSDGISMFAFDGQDTSGQTSIGTVVNQAGGTIEGNRYGIILTGGGTVENAGTIRGPLQPTGLSDGAGGVVVQDVLGADGKSGVVVNTGTITGGFGVEIAGGLDSAEITNSGTIEGLTNKGIENVSSGTVTVNNEVGGTITGATSGVYAESGAIIVNNAGTIRGNGTYDGFDTTPDAGIGIAQPASSIINSGAISGAGAGITTAYVYNPETDALEGLAIGVTVENKGSIVGDSNDGVRLIGGGTVVNSGLIAGRDGDFADGISMFAFDDQDTSSESAIGTVVNATGGRIEGVRFGVILTGGGIVENAGTISGNEGAILIQAGEAGKSAAVTNSGTLTGGVIISTDSNSLTNTGTVTSETGPAVLALGATALDNAGTIAGTGPVAVQFDISDDALTLRTGSAINGAVDGGEGIDTVILAGTTAGLSESQRVGALTNFESLTVDSGYWATDGAVGEFEQVAINSGAALKVTQVNLEVGGESPVGTSAVVNNGLVVLDFSTDDVVSNLDNLSISGTGGIRLEGEAVFTVDTDNLTYTGTTTIANGGLVVTSSLKGDVVTSGDGFFQLGDGGTAGTFEGDLVNNGEFVFNRSDDYDFLGDFSGTGLLTKMGAGTLTFAGGYAFTGATTILGGAVKLAGQVDPDTQFELGEEGQLDVSGTPQTIGGLAGAEGANVNVANSTLTVDQATDTAFAGTIEGDGGIVKEGDGLLNLTGNSTYTGPTSVNGGTLAVNGSIVSSVTVNQGGRLGGNGQVGNTNIASGGIVGPGNSIGRLTVDGDIDFAAGSVYEVEVNAAGEGDRIDATGAATISAEATVQVLAEDGNYRPRTDYTILSAAGGVSGAFGTVTTDLAFLTPRLAYGANSVTLSLYRNDIDFLDVAATFNQAGVAGAVEALGIGDPIYEEVLVQNAAGAQGAFDALSGEIHASTLSALTDEARHVREALLETMRHDAARVRAWGRVLGDWGKADARLGVAELETDHSGLIAGLDFGTPAFRFGIAAGVSGSDYEADARASRSDVQSRFVGAQAGYAAGAFRATVGGAYAWHDVETSRGVNFAGISQSLVSETDANTFQLFGEIAYEIDLGSLGIAPFARLAHVGTELDGFAETGGSAALELADSDQDANFLIIGAEARVNRAGRFQPRVSLGWQHGWGDLEGIVTSAFVAGGSAFRSEGSRIPDDAAAIDAGFDLDLGQVRIGASYNGMLSDDWSTHGARATLTASF